jgi:hypothetical protein
MNFPSLNLNLNRNEYEKGIDFLILTMGPKWPRGPARAVRGSLAWPVSNWAGPQGGHRAAESAHGPHNGAVTARGAWRARTRARARTEHEGQQLTIAAMMFQRGNDGTMVRAALGDPTRR